MIPISMGIIIKEIKKYLPEIDTPDLITILKILNDELKKRIEKFEKKNKLEK